MLRVAAAGHNRNNMATKMKALIGFGKMKDDELVISCNTIIGAMTGNAKYPAPTPELTDIQILLDDFTAKLAVARKRGSPEDTALKDESRSPLIVAMQQLGYYVNSVDQGHLSTLLSSGFPTNSTSFGNQVPLKVDNVRLSDGRQSGQVRLDFAPQKIATIYEYRYRIRTDSPTEWGDRFTTTSSRGNIIAPLEVGKFYEVQVRAINTQGVGDWSNAASILVR
ncbi:fibronectin type III domain-containing protein [Sphingobacterium thalpophilum]|uniref:fibronectin type III domain-containing protein n=1 Tax=Sphingobacterium thalpophilum TaxID=259 RepID=UPI0024A7416D|nr:fibronectin type III domain-containing protein [Sphingobacterium thalpophilum]